LLPGLLTGGERLAGGGEKGCATGGGRAKKGATGIILLLTGKGAHMFLSRKKKRLPQEKRPSDGKMRCDCEEGWGKVDCPSALSAAKRWDMEGGWAGSMQMCKGENWYGKSADCPSQTCERVDVAATKVKAKQHQIFEKGGHSRAFVRVKKFVYN